MDDLKSLSQFGKLKNAGYSIRKSKISEKLLQQIKEQLTLTPKTHKDFSKFTKKVPAYFEDDTHIYLPKHWAKKHIGEAAKNAVRRGIYFDKELKVIFPPRKHQVPVIDKTYKQLKSMGGAIITVPCGFGKCHGFNTPILMYDGSIKMVQDIKIGDKLMGDDSTPRNVLSTCTGKEMLYEVVPNRGMSYIINESHILSLKCSTRCKFGKKNTKFDISLKDYLKLPKMYNKSRGSPICGYKIGVDFNTKPIDLDPYILGLWLGDGSSNGYTITNQVLQKYNLIKNKHIPIDYKCNSRTNRLKLLAGLIDSDGYKSKKCNFYQITQKNEKLLDDIVYLALSLGFYAEKKVVWKRCTNGKSKIKKKYFRTQITGFGIEKIPVLIEGKKCKLRKQIKDPLNSLITVKKLKVGNYYGFTLDGNHRYLLGDFTVTHNTFVALNLITLLKQKTLIIVHTSVLMDQWIERIKSFIPDADVGIIKGNKFDIEKKDIVVGMLQSVVSKTKKYTRKEFSEFGFTVLDECFPYRQHIMTSDGPIKIGSLFERWKKNHKLPLIKSFNINTKNFEFKKMVRGYRKIKKELLKIHFGKKKVKCTPNHKFLTDNGYVKASDLRIDDLIISNYKTNKTESCVSKVLNDDQFQIVIGSFLGDGHVDILPSNRYRLRICHGEKQKEYCKWKSSMFKIQKLRYVEKNGYSSTPLHYFSTKIFDLKYNIPSNTSHCPQWMLDKIDERGLCIWFLDDGSCSKSNATLSTHSFNLDSNKRMINMFKNKFNIEATLKVDKRKLQYYLYFSKINFEKIKKLVKKYVVNKCMKYKINDEEQNNVYRWSNNFFEYGYLKISNIEKDVNKGANKCKTPYVYDIEVEDNHNYIVCSSINENGPVVSNCHHIAAPSFSKSIPIVSSKYNLGLSATPKRTDNLQNIFYWNIGPPSWEDYSNDGKFVIVKNIEYLDSNYVEKRKWNGSVDLHKLADQLIENKKRHQIIIHQLKYLSDKKRQILLLSTRINHLEILKNLFDKIKSKNVTTSFYIGGMKKSELEKASKCDVLFASYQLVSEGTDIPTLNTLVMAFPKKQIQQVVGRILRSKTKHTPLVVDITDSFNVYKNQSLFRKRYYKKNNYHIEDIYMDNYSDIKIIKDEIETEKEKHVENEQQEKITECLFNSDSDF